MGITCCSLKLVVILALINVLVSDNSYDRQIKRSKRDLEENESIGDALYENHEVNKREEIVVPSQNNDDTNSLIDSTPTGDRKSIVGKNLKKKTKTQHLKTKLKKGSKFTRAQNDVTGKETSTIHTDDQDARLVQGMDSNVDHPMANSDITKRYDASTDIIHGEMMGISDTDNYDTNPHDLKRSIMHTIYTTEPHSQFKLYLNKLSLDVKRRSVDNESEQYGGAPSHFQVDDKSADLEINANSAGVKVKAKPASLQVVSRPGSAHSFSSPVSLDPQAYVPPPPVEMHLYHQRPHHHRHYHHRRHHRRHHHHEDFEPERFSGSYFHHNGFEWNQPHSYYPHFFGMQPVSMSWEGFPSPYEYHFGGRWISSPGYVRSNVEGALDPRLNSGISANGFNPGIALPDSENLMAENLRKSLQTESERMALDHLQNIHMSTLREFAQSQEEKRRELEADEQKFQHSRWSFPDSREMQRAPLEDASHFNSFRQDHSSLLADHLSRDFGQSSFRDPYLEMKAEQQSKSAFDRFDNHDQSLFEAQFDPSISELHHHSDFISHYSSRPKSHSDEAMGSSMNRPDLFRMNGMKKRSFKEEGKFENNQMERSEFDMPFLRKQIDDVNTNQDFSKFRNEEDPSDQRTAYDDNRVSGQHSALREFGDLPEQQSMFREGDDQTELRSAFKQNSLFDADPLSLDPHRSMGVPDSASILDGNMADSTLLKNPGSLPGLHGDQLNEISEQAEALKEDKEFAKISQMQEEMYKKLNDVLPIGDMPRPDLYPTESKKTGLKHEIPTEDRNRKKNENEDNGYGYKKHEVPVESQRLFKNEDNYKKDRLPIEDLKSNETFTNTTSNKNISTHDNQKSNITEQYSKPKNLFIEVSKSKAISFDNLFSEEKRLGTIVSDKISRNVTKKSEIGHLNEVSRVKSQLSFINNKKNFGLKRKQSILSKGKKKNDIIVRRPQIVYHPPAEIYHRPPIILHRPPLMIQRPPIVYHQPPVVVHRPPIIYTQPLLVFHQPHPVVHQPFLNSEDHWTPRTSFKHIGSSLTHGGGWSSVAAGNSMPGNFPGINNRINSSFNGFEDGNNYGNNINALSNLDAALNSDELNTISSSNEEFNEPLNSETKISDLTLNPILTSRSSRKSSIHPKKNYFRKFIHSKKENKLISRTRRETEKNATDHKSTKKDVVVNRPPIIYHPPPEIYHRPDIVIHRPPIVIHRPPIIYHQPPVIVHRPAVVYHQPPIIFHQPPPAVQQPLLYSHDTFVVHPSFVAQHMGSILRTAHHYIGPPRLLTQLGSPLFESSSMEEKASQQEPLQDASPSNDFPNNEQSNLNAFANYQGVTEENTRNEDNQYPQVQNMPNNGDDSGALSNEMTGNKNSFNSLSGRSLENTFSNSDADQSVMNNAIDNPSMQALSEPYNPIQDGYAANSNQMIYKRSITENTYGRKKHLTKETKGMKRQNLNDDSSEYIDKISPDLNSFQGVVHTKKGNENIKNIEIHVNGQHGHDIVVHRPGVLFHPPPEVIARPNLIIHRPPLLIHRPPIIVHQAPVVIHRPSILYHQPDVIFHSSPLEVHQPIHEPFSDYNFASRMPTVGITNPTTADSFGVEEVTIEHSLTERIPENINSVLKKPEFESYSDHLDQTESIADLEQTNPSITVDHVAFLDDINSYNTYVPNNRERVGTANGESHDSSMKASSNFFSQNENNGAENYAGYTRFTVPTNSHKKKKHKKKHEKNNVKVKRDVSDLTHKVTQPHFHTLRNALTHNAQTNSRRDRSLVNSLSSDVEPIDDPENENYGTDTRFREETLPKDDVNTEEELKAENPSSRTYVEGNTKRGLRCSACGNDCDPLCRNNYAGFGLVSEAQSYNEHVRKPVVYNHEPSIVVYKPPVIVRQSPVVVHPVLHRHRVLLHHLDDYQLYHHSQACDCSDEYKNDCLCSSRQHHHKFNRKHHIGGKKHPRSEVEAANEISSSSQSFKRCIDCGTNCDPGCHSNDYYGYGQNGLGEGFNNGHPIFSNSHATFEGGDNGYNGGQWAEDRDHEFGLGVEQELNGFHNNGDTSDDNHEFNNYGMNEFSDFGVTHNEPHHNHETTVYKRPDIVVPQPPDIIHRPDIVIHRAPIIVHRRPIVYHQAPVIVHKPPVVVHQAPIVVHPVVHHHRILTHHVHDYHVEPHIHHSTCDCEDKKDCICEKSSERGKNFVEKNLRSLIPNAAQSNSSLEHSTSESFKNNTLEDFKTSKKKKKDVVVSRPPIIYHPPPEIYHRPDIVVHRPPLLIHRPSIIYHQPPVIVHRPAVVYHQPPLVFHQPPPAVQQPLLVSHDTFKFHPSAYYTHMGSVVNKVGSYVGVPHGPIINYPHSPYYGTTGYGPAPPSGYHGFGNGRVPYADPESGEGHEPIMSLPNGHGAEGYDQPPGNMHDEESFEHEQQDFPHTGGVEHRPTGDFNHFGAPSEIHQTNNFNHPEGNFGNPEFGQRGLSEQFNNHPEQQFGYPANGINQNNQGQPGPNDGFGPQGYERSFSESSSSEQQAVMGGMSGGVSGEENSPIGHLGAEDFNSQQPPPFKRTFIAKKEMNIAEQKNENEDDNEESNNRDRRSVHLHYQKNHHQRPDRRHRVVVGRPDIIYHQAPEIVHRPPLIVHRPDIVIHRPSVIVHRPPVVVHRPAIMYHQPPVVFNTPLPVIHQPNAVSHDMYVTHSYPHRIGSRVFPSGGTIAQVSNIEHVENMGQSANFPNEENMLQDADSGISNSEPNEDHDFGIQGPSAYNNGFPAEGWGTGPNAGVDVTPNNVENIGADYESPVRNQYAAGMFSPEEDNGYSPGNVNSQPLVPGENQAVDFGRGESNGNFGNHFATGSVSSNKYAVPEEEHPWTKSKVPKKKLNQVSAIKKQVLGAGNHGGFSGTGFPSNPHADDDRHADKYFHGNSEYMGCEGSGCHGDGFGDAESLHDGNERFVDGYGGHNGYDHEYGYNKHHPAGAHATVLYRPDVIFHPRPELYHRPDIIVHRPDVVIHRPSVVIHQPPVLVHRPAVIVHQPPIIFHQPPPVVHRPLAVSHDHYLLHNSHEHVGSHLEHTGHLTSPGGYYIGAPFRDGKEINNLGHHQYGTGNLLNYGNVINNNCVHGSHGFGCHNHESNGAGHSEITNEGNLIGDHGFPNNINSNFGPQASHNILDYNLGAGSEGTNTEISQDFDNTSPISTEAHLQEEKRKENKNFENSSSKSVVARHKAHKKKKNKSKSKVRREITDPSNHTELDNDLEKKSKVQNSSKKHHVTVIHRPDVVFHQRPEVIHRPDIIVHRPDVVINRPDVIIHRPAVIVHKPPMVIHQAPIVFHHSHPMMHQPVHHQNDLYVQNTYPVHVESHIENLGHDYPLELTPQTINGPHVYGEPMNAGHIMMERGHEVGGVASNLGIGHDTVENDYHLGLGNNNNCNGYDCHNFGGEPVGHEHLIGPIGFAPQVPDTEDDDARSHIPKRNNQTTGVKKHHVTVIHRPDIIYHPKPEIVHRPDVIVHRPDIVIHRPSVVVHRPPVVVHKSPVIIHQPPIILHQPNPIINQPVHESHDIYAMKQVPIQVGSHLEHIGSNTNLQEQLGSPLETNSNILGQGNYHDTQTFPINGQHNLFNGRVSLNQSLNFNDQGNNGVDSINYLSASDRTAETQASNSLENPIIQSGRNLNNSFLNTDETHDDTNAIGNYKQDYAGITNVGQVTNPVGDLNLRSGDVSCDENPDTPQCSGSKKNKVLKRKSKKKLKNITGFKRDFGYGGGEGMGGDCQGSHCPECHDGHCGSDVSEHQGEESFGHNGFGDIIGQHSGGGIVGHGGVSGHQAGNWGDHGGWGHGHENTWEHHNDHHHHHADEQNIVVQRPDIVFHPRPELYHRPDIIVHRPDIVIHRPSVVIHQPPVLVHRPAVIYHQPPVVFHQPGPVVHRPRVVSHDMYVTHDQHEHVGSQIEHADGGTIVPAGYYENHDLHNSHDCGDDHEYCGGGGTGGGSHENGEEGGGYGGEHHDDEGGYGGGHHFEGHGHGLGGHGFTCLGGHCGHEDEHAFKRFLVESGNPEEISQNSIKRHRVVVFRPPIIYHPPPEIYHRADLIVHRPDVIISRPSVVVHRPDVVIHRPNIVYHQPPVVFYTPPPHIHQPIMKSHDAYVTHPLYHHIGSNVQHVGGVILAPSYPSYNMPLQEASNEFETSPNQFSNEDALQGANSTPLNGFTGQSDHEQEQTQEPGALDDSHEDEPEVAENGVLNENNINVNPDILGSSVSLKNTQEKIGNEPQAGYNVAGLGKSKVAKLKRHHKKAHKRYRKNVAGVEKKFKSAKKVGKSNKKKKLRNKSSSNKSNSRATKKTEIEDSEDKKKGPASKKNDIIVKRPPVIYHPPPEIYHRPPIIVHRPPLVIRRPPIIYHQPPVIVHRPAVVYHQPPLIFHQPPPAVSQPILKSHDTFMMHPAARLTHMGSMVTNAGTYVGVPEHRFMYQGGMGFFRAPEQEHQEGYAAGEGDNTHGEGTTYMSAPRMDDFNQGMGGSVSELTNHQRNSMLENIDNSDQHQIGEGQYLGGQGRDQLSNEQGLMYQEPAIQQQQLSDGEQQFVDSSNNQVAMGSPDSGYAAQPGGEEAYGRNLIPSSVESNLEENEESAENDEEEEEDADNRVEQYTGKKQTVVAKESKRKSIEKPLLKIIKGTKLRKDHESEENDAAERKKRQIPFFNPYQMRQDVPQFNPNNFYKPQRRHHKTSVNIDVVGKRSISNVLNPRNQKQNHFLF